MSASTPPPGQPLSSTYEPVNPAFLKSVFRHPDGLSTARDLVKRIHSNFEQSSAQQLSHTSTTAFHPINARPNFHMPAEYREKLSFSEMQPQPPAPLAHPAHLRTHGSPQFTESSDPSYVKLSSAPSGFFPPSHQSTPSHGHNQYDHAANYSDLPTTPILQYPTSSFMMDQDQGADQANYQSQTSAFQSINSPMSLLNSGHPPSHVKTIRRQGSDVLKRTRTSVLTTQSFTSIQLESRNRPYSNPQSPLQVASAPISPQVRQLESRSPQRSAPHHAHQMDPWPSQTSATSFPLQPRQLAPQPPSKSSLLPHGRQLAAVALQRQLSTHDIALPSGPVDHVAKPRAIASKKRKPDTDEGLPLAKKVKLKKATSLDPSSREVKDMKAKTARKEKEVKKKLMPQLPDDIWMRILEYTPPQFTMTKGRLICKSITRMVDGFVSIIVNQRKENYGADMPDPPLYMTERQFMNLLGGKGCFAVGCKDLKVTRTHWSWAKRWCNKCWKEMVEREDRVYKTHHNYSRVVLTKMLECIPVGMHDSFMKPHDYVEDIDSRPRGTPRLYKYYMKNDIDAIIKEYEALAPAPYVQDPTHSPEQQAAAAATHQAALAALEGQRDAFFTAKKAENDKWMTWVRTVEGCCKKRREANKIPNEENRQARKTMFLLRAREDLFPEYPAITEDFIKEAKCYRAATRIFRDPGTERGWQVLKLKIIAEWEAKGSEEAVDGVALSQMDGSMDLDSDDDGDDGTMSMHHTKDVQNTHDIEKSVHDALASFGNTALSNAQSRPARLSEHTHALGSRSRAAHTMAQYFPPHHATWPNVVANSTYSSANLTGNPPFSHASPSAMYTLANYPDYGGRVPHPSQTVPHNWALGVSHHASNLQYNPHYQMMPDMRLNQTNPNAGTTQEHRAKMQISSLLSNQH